MAGFDPKEYGFDTRVDVGLFLFAGGLAGIIDAMFDLARSDPLTLGAAVGVTVVGAKRLFLDSDRARPSDDGSPRPPG